MTLVFPGNIGIVETDFDLKFGVVGTPLRGGFLQKMEISEPRWQIAISTTNMSNNDLGALRAWWNSLEGGMNDFFIHDTARPIPANYETLTGLAVSGGGAFDGTCNVVSYPTAKSISLDGLPDSFALKTGDYIGLEEGNNRSLHHILSDVTASVGGAVVVPVSPYVSTNVFTTAAVARLDRPVIKVVPNVDSWSGSPQLFHGSASFSAMQVLF